MSLSSCWSNWEFSCSLSLHHIWNWANWPLLLSLVIKFLIWIIDRGTRTLLNSHLLSYGLVLICFNGCHVFLCLNLYFLPLILFCLILQNQSINSSKKSFLKILLSLYLLINNLLVQPLHILFSNFKSSDFLTSIF